jgi:hypothetical protein
MDHAAVGQTAMEAMAAAISASPQNREFRVSSQLRVAVNELVKLALSW